MRRVVSILFLSLMLLQAIPVLHFFSSNKAAFYTLIDEEKPDEKSDTGKKEFSDSHSALGATTPASETGANGFLPFLLSAYVSPTLDALTPPPNQ